ncbi:hypothetical protein IAD21_03640 [Abditibacteriota bacterium]|nr:hypothetical protein IAD21_03640 [Abditibacteriota bacterium]
MRSLFSPVVLGTLAFCSLASAQTPAKFPFSLPWDDATRTVISAADLNPAPLTNTQKISVKDGHFFDASGRRVRFLGTNLVGNANFSRSGDAILFAGRLHKLGINCVRLHHMDAEWANPNIFGANRDNSTQSNAQVAPPSLDLLDFTVAQLKKNGVYVDLNLHVSREPKLADGFPDDDKLPEMGKVTAYFDPQFIAMQKEYARQILTHRNPYTGQKWADDPVVALVELNNEDTLVGQAWSGTLQGLPPRYRTTLQDGWNRFLKARYTSTTALRKAWSAPVDTGTLPNLLSNGQFATGTQGWSLETQDNAQGQISVVDIQNPPTNGPRGKAIRIQITQKPDADWKLQLHQTGLNLRSSSWYTLGYWIRADKARTASNYFALDQDPWSQIGGQKDLALNPAWQYVRVVFKTGTTIANHSRLSFALGNTTDAVEIADVQLATGAQALVPTTQTLEDSTLDLPPAQGSSPGQGRDWIDYLMTIESAYVSTMRDTIRNECGFKGPIACSQESYGGFGGVARESASEWTDMHAYWQHPNFPGQAWDSKNWTIGNTPMLNDPKGGTLAELAPYHVEGKPFIVSEYNHPAPNDYASETVPLILSYAAMQDWDGLFLFSWNGDRDNWNPNKIRGYFDMDSDPNKTVFIPLMARAFLSGALAPAPAQTTLTIPQSALVDMTAQTQGGGAGGSFWDNVSYAWRSRGLGLTDILNSRVGMNLTAGRVALQLARVGPRSALTGNPSFNWGFVGGNGRLLVDSPSVKALVGRVAGNFWPLGVLSVENPSSSNGWMSLVMVARDGKPLEKSNSIIVGALNRAENSGMTWNADRTSVGEGWGSGPTLLETPSATLDLQTASPRVGVWKLDPTGKRTVPVAATLQNGHLRFTIAPSDQTPWYEIALNSPPTAKAATTSITVAELKP